MFLLVIKIQKKKKKKKKMKDRQSSIHLIPQHRSNCGTCKLLNNSALVAHHLMHSIDELKKMRDRYVNGSSKSVRGW
jgi:hypothetical protein